MTQKQIISMLGGSYTRAAIMEWITDAFQHPLRVQGTDESGLCFFPLTLHDHRRHFQPSGWLFVLHEGRLRLFWATPHRSSSAAFRKLNKTSPYRLSEHASIYDELRGFQQVPSATQSFTCGDAEISVPQSFWAAPAVRRIIEVVMLLHLQVKMGHLFATSFGLSTLTAPTPLPQTVWWCWRHSAHSCNKEALFGIGLTLWSQLHVDSSAFEKRLSFQFLVSLYSQRTLDATSPHFRIEPGNVLPKGILSEGVFSLSSLWNSGLDHWIWAKLHTIAIASLSELTQRPTPLQRQKFYEHRRRQSLIRSLMLD